MTPAIKWLYLITLGLWVGSIIFFSFVIAPTVFRTLKPEDAARLQRALFPKYYLVGVICAGMGIGCVGMLVMQRAFGKWPGLLSLFLLAVMGATDLWLRQSVVTHMAEIREQRAAAKEPDPALEAEWKSLHRLSVQLNGAVLLAGLVLVFLVVFARVV